jgi:gamma-glutamylcyclotransferase (GGCT)/AIG2-like uncharacterized protein YtfP
MQIFVYGTLLKGLERNGILAASKYLTHATIQADLYDCGDYPGVVQGTGTVHGELYAIDRDTLDKLDRVEGYQEDNQAASLFIRRQVQVKANPGYETTAFCYFYNQDVVNLTRIEHGNYVRYRSDLIDPHSLDSLSQLGRLIKITPQVFSSSLFYIGPGYDIEPLLRFTHLTDSFIYVNLYLSRNEVRDWYDEQFDRHPDIEILSANYITEFDETKNYTLHPDYISHLMRPTFLHKQELDDYLGAFEPARKLSQWAIVYHLRRKSSGRVITLYYLTAEGLASYIVLSQNGRYAPRILTTIRTNVLEDPKGLMNRFFAHEQMKKPELWIRGFMPEPEVYTDFWGQETQRRNNNALEAAGVFSVPALSFNKKWLCGLFDDDDISNSRHCKGFVSPARAEQLSRVKGLQERLQGNGRHQLLVQDILPLVPAFTAGDFLVIPERFLERLGPTAARIITWESIVPRRYDFWSRRNHFVSAAEQLRLLWRKLEQYQPGADAVIHLLPHCREDEGEQFFAELAQWPVETRTYIVGLLDFIDIRE